MSMYVYVYVCVFMFVCFCLFMCMCIYVCFLYVSLMRTPIDMLWDLTKILEYLPNKAKIQILIENHDPTFISEMWTKGISNRPWLNDYNGIMNQRYKFWTPQGRIPKKFTVLEKPKEEQSLTFSDFYSILLLQWVHAIYMSWLKIFKKKKTY